jgi:alpha-beta hydrolase superfamily lysophospholipase
MIMHSIRSTQLFLLPILLSITFLVSGCAPVNRQIKPIPGVARLTDSTFVTADAEVLPLSRWPVAKPKAVIVALHGFNDYRKFFSSTAEYLQTQQIYSYAYDQRGFGASSNTGIWAGSDTYARDLFDFTQLIQSQHPGIPIYLLGESMGGAIIIDTMSRQEKPTVNGVILSAPAVWGRQTMPWYQTSLLWTLSHTVPWMTLTGKGLEILPSDNIEMLRALGRDPLVIKETRVDAIYGLTDLMDSALGSADKLNTDTLLLYGKKDQVVPPEPTALFVEKLIAQQPTNKTIAYYDNGYHMLLRDLEAPLIWQDIANWIFNSCAKLPSRADQNSKELLKDFSKSGEQPVIDQMTESTKTSDHCESKAL